MENGGKVIACGVDACKAFVIKGEEVKLVEGEVYNIKITTLHDLKLSNAILVERTKE